MQIDGEMRRKIVVSVVSVGFFIALILGIGATSSNDGIGSSGGLALVGSIVLFLVVMGLVGFWLSRSG